MKVKYFPNQPHCFAFGGFEIQMLCALDASIKSGVDSSKLDIWSRDSNFDILHVWGMESNNFPAIYWAKRSNKKVVATVLVSYMDRLIERLKFKRFLLTRRYREIVHYYNLLDGVIVVNEIQAKILQNYFKVDQNKIFVIPNIVSKPYYTKPIFSFSDKYEISDYILSVGNICSRKNQINLAKACINTNNSLVIIGKVLDGEEEYGKQLSEIVKSNGNIKWIPGLEFGSDELISAYYNCKAFALPSFGETQPISALEAVAAGKTLILPDRKFSHQKYYKNVILCKSTSVIDISIALTNLSKTNFTYNYTVNECSEKAVGDLHKAVYSKIFYNN
jgi:glycosyltransferase involved in cell wall biosynthesis